MNKHIYIFNWKQGGWNSIWATNIRSARKQAREQWCNGKSTPSSPSTKIHSNG